MGREDSLWYHMRIFHNNIKRNLINGVVEILRNDNNINLSLIDVSMGRGGDLDKWFKNDINTVTGADINIKSIEEAEKRKKNYIKGLKGSEKDKWKKIFKNYKYINSIMDLRQPYYNIPYTLPDHYDIVSCQFSFHYFFKSDNVLNNAIKNISNLLIPGGYFIGTAPVKVKNKLIIDPKYNIKDKLGNSVGLLKRISSDSNSYTFQLYDKDDSGNYFTDVDPLLEYFIDINKMIRICKSHNLEFINTISFEELYNQSKRPEKIFMKEYEKDVSFLYNTFKFKKVLKFED